MQPPLHQHRPTLEAELQRIRNLVLAMGEMVDTAIGGATRALTGRDVAAADAVIAGDEQVNAAKVQVHERALSLILTQAPVAGDLREILGLLHMSDELERMADHCVNVARIGRDLADLPPLSVPVDLTALARACADQVRDMLTAVVSRDVEGARQVAARDDRVNRIHHRLVDDILQAMLACQANVYAGTRLILASTNFERIGDRVTNLAEDLVFLASGVIEELG